MRRKKFTPHNPSKIDAEMVLAYIDGNPDKPLGLGFVPNGDALSLVTNKNSTENIMRSWGGSELLMDDSYDNKNIKLSTPDKRHLELHDGDELARLKSADSELLLDDKKKHATIDAGGHVIRIDYKEDSGEISITTLKGCE